MGAPEAQGGAALGGLLLLGAEAGYCLQGGGGQECVGLGLGLGLGKGVGVVGRQARREGSTAVVAAATAGHGRGGGWPGRSEGQGGGIGQVKRVRNDEEAVGREGQVVDGCGVGGLGVAIGGGEEGNGCEIVVVGADVREEDNRVTAGGFGVVVHCAKCGVRIGPAKVFLAATGKHHFQILLRLEPPQLGPLTRG